jgi:phytoene dehydrogenase-like protein
MTNSQSPPLFIVRSGYSCQTVDVSEPSIPATEQRVTQLFNHETHNQQKTIRSDHHRHRLAQHGSTAPFFEPTGNAYALQRPPHSPTPVHGLSVTGAAGEKAIS